MIEGGFCTTGLIVCLEGFRQFIEMGAKNRVE